MNKRSLSLALSMALLPLMMPTNANALIIPGAVFTVDSRGDEPDAAIDGTCATASGVCTLRAAIEEANASAGVDTINFAVTGTITLSSSLPTIVGGVTIQGPGSDILAISAANQFRIIEVNSGGSTVNVNVNDLTLRDGVGVAIDVQSPDALGLHNCVITAMSVPISSAPGAISNNSIMNISGCEITANSGDGHVISNNFSTATLTIERSSITENQITAGRGNITNWGGTVTIVNTTISGNSGIAVNNNTFSPPAGTVNITSSTIANNTGAGISNATGGTINIKQTILAGNGVNCSGVGALPTSAGYNIEDVNSCALAMAGDQANTDPKLASLANNSVGYANQTRTHALPSTSPAVDAGDPTAGCPAVVSGTAVSTDQRGRSRPYDGNGDMAAICDIGAYEIAPGINISVASQPLSTSENGTSATLDIKLETPPTADVQVSLSSSDTTEGTVTPASMTFTPSNWGSIQQATVTGVDDSVVDGAVRYNVLVDATSADPNYTTSTSLTVPAVNADNDGSSTSASGGGGAIGPLWLFALGFFAWFRRRLTT